MGDARSALENLQQASMLNPDCVRSDILRLEAQCSRASKKSLDPNQGADRQVRIDPPAQDSRSLDDLAAAIEGKSQAKPSRGKASACVDVVSQDKTSGDIESGEQQ